MEDSKGKKWYQDSGGKVSPKRILGTIGFSLILIAWLLSGLDFYDMTDIQMNQVPALLAVVGGMLAAGGFTKGG